MPDSKDRNSPEGTSNFTRQIRCLGSPRPTVRRAKTAVACTPQVWNYRPSKGREESDHLFPGHFQPEGVAVRGNMALVVPRDLSSRQVAP
jgi:hypothetical protein